MVERYSTRQDPKGGPITQDTKITTPIDGKILKVFVMANTVPENARIKIETQEYETVIDKKLEQPWNIYYPFMDVARITNEQGWADHFYSKGMLSITITGLRTGEVIKDIRIFYE